MSFDCLDKSELPACGCSTPGTADAASCYCGVEDLLRIIRRRYSLSVMNAIRARDHARYHDIAAALPQASSSTLAETLRALQAASLLERRDHGGDATHVEYRLTASGRKLISRLRILLEDVQSG